MKNVKEIKLDTSGAIVIYCYGAEAYKKYMKKYFGYDRELDSAGLNTGFVCEDGFRVVVAVRDDFPDPYFLKACIVHELSHAVTQIMEQFGFNCDEFRSYTLAYLYRKFVKFTDNLTKSKEK